MVSRPVRLLSVLAGACLLAWGGGFIWFVQTASRPGLPLPHADGIVVLTGGSNRIAQGMRLLAAGQAPRLLVSGVAQGTDIRRLVREAGLQPGVAGDLAGRVTLGRSAISTHGNAEETVDWVHDHQLRSLIVVTAFYHMPRALAELRRALPGTVLYAHPVLPDVPGRADAGGPPHRPAPQLLAIGLLAEEYTKWLAMQSGLPRYAPDRRPGIAPDHALIQASG